MGLFVDDIVARVSMEGDAEFRRKVRGLQSETAKSTRGMEDAFRKVGVASGGVLTKISAFAKGLVSLRTVGVVLVARELLHLSTWLVKVGDSSKTLQPRIDTLGKAFKDKLAGVLQATVIPVLDQVIARLERIVGISPTAAVAAARVAAAEAKVEARKAENDPFAFLRSPESIRRRQMTAQAELNQARAEANTQSKLAAVINPYRVLRDRRGIGAPMNLEAEKAAREKAREDLEKLQAFGRSSASDIAFTSGTESDAAFIDKVLGFDPRRRLDSKGMVEPLDEKAKSRALEAHEKMIGQMRDEVEAYEHDWEVTLQGIQVGMGFLGARAKGVLGGVAGISGGFAGLTGSEGPLSGSKFAKSFAKTLGEIGFAGQIAAGAIGIIKGIGGLFRGVSAREASQGKSDDEIRADIARLENYSGPGESWVRGNVDEMRAVLKERESAASGGSQAFSSVTQITESQANLLVAVNETMRIQDAHRNELLTEIRDSSRNIEFLTAANTGGLFRFQGIS